MKSILSRKYKKCSPFLKRRAKRIINKGQNRKYVKAKSQADILKRLEEHLTDKEKDIVRRGRNAENHHLPKNANVEEYMYSTAFEALIGYLYLCKKDERIKEIFDLILDEN